MADCTHNMVAKLRTVEDTLQHHLSNLVDTDGDTLSDGQEVNELKSDPNNTDTDGDGRSDSYEVNRGLNPLVNEVNALVPMFDIQLEQERSFGYTMGAQLQLMHNMEAAIEFGFGAGREYANLTMTMRF